MWKRLKEARKRVHELEYDLATLIRSKADTRSN
jgi:hypothetical protein